VPRIVMSTIFALGLVALGVLWVVDPAAPSWWPVRESWWLIGGWATGSTLIASGVIALALIVWSIKQFRGVDDPQAKAERLSAP
jgi:hypothetical protein